MSFARKHSQQRRAIGLGLERANKLREFITDSAGPDGGAELAVFSDLAAIDDMISELMRTQSWLEQNLTTALSPVRAESVATILTQLENWTTAVEAGKVRPGELQRLSED
jgi:hypothetical protein